MGKKLNNILENAVNNTSFYFQEVTKYNDIVDFYDHFVLDKNDIVNNMYDMISKKYSGNLYKSMQVNTTSGTSGVPVKILWHPDDLMRSNLSIWRLRKKFHNISPNDCYCSLHTVSYLGERTNNVEKIIINNNEISFCKLYQDDGAMHDYYNTMNKYKPKWLLFQPSFALNFVDFCIRKNLPPINSIEYIEFTGELLTASMRFQVSAFFNCFTANMYGCMETNSIAYECPYGSMHVLEDNVQIELDENKNVYLTSLYNEAFPLIKYNVGDKIDSISHYSCPCGITGKVIGPVIGRSSKEINLKTGKIITEPMIVYCVERAESVVGIGLKKYHAIFADDILTIQIISTVADNNWRDVFIKELKKQFEIINNNVFVDIIFVKEIISTEKELSTGKYSILEVK